MRESCITYFLRRLNRTLLKKTGTKNAYLTDTKFLQFFGFKNIGQLTTTQDYSNKIVFYFKNTQNQRKDLLFDEDAFIEMHIVRGVNTEIRLSGKNFSNILNKYGITETDSIIIEKVNNNEQIKYYMSFSFEINTIVLEQFSEGKNEYWIWDNYAGIESWDDNECFNAFVYNNGACCEKKLRLKFLRNESIEMRARNEAQEKKIFSIEELIDGKWTNKLLFSQKLLEFTKMDKYITVCDREKLLSKIIECEVLK